MKGKMDMRFKQLFFPVIVAVLLVSNGSAVFGEESDKNAKGPVYWDVISGGGNSSQSVDYQLYGTIGQTSVGMPIAASYSLKSGFWQSFAGVAACNCLPGDVDNNEILNLMDVTYFIRHLYKGGPPPVQGGVCPGDPNRDCVINILDITYLINYLYRDGPDPANCDEWRSGCGTDVGA